MRFHRVTLNAPAVGVSALGDFYGTELQFNFLQRSAVRFAFALGETTIEFVQGSGGPFYHFAFLVPGNRFDQALDWIRGRAALLPDPDSHDIRVDFANWHASACFFHDPAGNIVELIAHRGYEDTRTNEPFLPREFIGLSELGLVGEPHEMAQRLADELNLHVWDGTLDVPHRIAFVGERARSLILSRPGRGWRPTGRPAEPYPIEVVLAGTSAGDIQLEASVYRIRSLSPADLPPGAG